MMHIYILLRSNIIKCVNKVAKCAFRAEAVTSQVCPYRSARSLTHPSRSALPPPLRHLRRPDLTFGKLQLGKLHNRGIASWNSLSLGKLPLGKFLWENTFGKLPLGKNLWENTFVKIPLGKNLTPLI